MRKSPRELWEDIREFDACMLVTRSEDQLRSRPMRPFFESRKETILFLTSADADKITEIKTCPEANVVFSSMREGLWISLTGKVRLSNRAQAVDACWTEEFDAWIDDREQAIALVFTPESAEYWDCSEKRAVPSWDMLESMANCGKPDPGENQKLALG
ncbi:MAG: pyridoxamine 5'-phosphate oxidase family protein [Rhizobiaceae bacterium]